MLKHDLINFPIRFIQHGVLHGGIEQCHNDRYPGIYTRVDNADVLSFINYEVFGEGTYNFLMRKIFQSISCMNNRRI